MWNKLTVADLCLCVSEPGVVYRKHKAHALPFSFGVTLKTIASSFVGVGRVGTRPSSNYVLSSISIGRCLQPFSQQWPNHFVVASAICNNNIITGGEGGEHCSMQHY